MPYAHKKSSRNKNPFAQTRGRLSTENPFTSRASSAPDSPPWYSKFKLEADETLFPFYQDWYRKCVLEDLATESSVTIFVVDDSGSMADSSWRETMNVTPNCTQYNEHGISVYFLSHSDSSLYKNITFAGTVAEIFQTVRPSGATPTSQCLQIASSSRCRAFQNTAPNDYDWSRTISRIQSIRINPAALAFLAVFALLPIIQAVPQHISTTWGIPIFNTLGVGTGLAISVFDNEANTDPVLYWTVYGFWSLSALLVVFFTTFSIRKSSRLRYLCTFFLVEFIILTVIAVSSIGDGGFVAKHLREWTPLATLAVAGALTAGFRRVA